MAKQVQLWTVRNAKGQFLGTYYALTAKAAIQRVVDDQLQTASTFRRSFRPVVDTTGWTAAVEPRKL